jgi:anti-sigma B factor antagonist
MHRPSQARELGAELPLVTAQDWAKRLLVNSHHISFLRSTGFAALFKLVSQAKTEGRQVRFCGMKPPVRLGAEIVGLDKVDGIHDNESSALLAFAKA